MKLFITGGAGFIGSAVVRQAIAAGHSVLNVDKLTYAANLANLTSIENSPHYTFIKADICDQSRMEDVFNAHCPDAVMHLAAESHVDRSIDGPSAFLQTNIMGTFSLLQATRGYWEGLTADKKESFRFHHVSTDEVYGDLEVDDPAFEESTAYDPSSPYSASKAASDHLVRAWGRTYGLPIVLSNCSNNYGPYQFPEKLIPVVILKALHGEPIPVYGAGENIRDWLYVEDHAEALLSVLQKGRVGATYNIGGNNERTNLELVQVICEILDKMLPYGAVPHRNLITFVKDRPGHDRRYAVNASKLKKELGWEPSVKKNEGLEQTIRWYLENEDWWLPLVKTASFGTRQGLKG